MKMPQPTDVAGVRRVLGMVTYLAKFLPNLSNVSAPLRQLERSGVEWSWGEAQEKALEEIRKLITSAPVLEYYDPSKTRTWQCDASQSGLGTALLQEGKPVCYI